jgi:hypothetical protein
MTGISRRDGFSMQVYMYSIKLGILLCQPETYLPSLKALLFNHVEQVQVLYSNLYLLHYICVMNSLPLYYDAKVQISKEAYHIAMDSSLDGLVRAIVQNNIISWINISKTRSIYERALLNQAMPILANSTLDAIAKAYYRIPKSQLTPYSTNIDSLILQRGWQQENDWIITRKIKITKSKPLYTHT